jgi:predicted amidohydrolase
MQWMAKTAAEKKAVVTGSMIIKENDHFYNRLIWMNPDGSFKQYDKRHLFRMADEHKVFTGGNKKTIVSLNGWRLCPLVCYDLRFPVWSRNRNEYDCLIYVANWPERRNYAWRHLLIARAIENQSFVIGVNRIGEDGKGITHSGDSAVIEPKGELISHIKAHTESIETIKLSYSELIEYRKAFPANLDADSFKIE